MTEQEIQQLPPFLTVEEAAALLRVGRSTMNELIYAKEVPALKIRAQWRIPRDRFLARLEELANN